MAESDNWDLKLEMLFADTWDDAELKQRLIDDPAAVLAERGLVVPEGVTIKVLADTEEILNLVLPPPPEEDLLSEEELEDVAGGFSRCYSGPSLACFTPGCYCRCRPASPCRCRPAPPVNTCRCRCRPSPRCRCGTVCRTD